MAAKALHTFEISKLDPSSYTVNPSSIVSRKTPIFALCTPMPGNSINLLISFSASKEGVQIFRASALYLSTSN